MVGLVVSVLAVHRGKKQPISLCKPCVMRVRGPNNFGAVQTDPTGSHGTAEMLGVVK